MTLTDTIAGWNLWKVIRRKRVSVSDAYHQDVIKFLEKANEFLSEEVQRLHMIINQERNTNRMLLSRLGIIENAKQEVKLGEVSPIGGFTPLRTRIQEMEAASRLEAEELEKALEDEK